MREAKERRPWRGHETQVFGVKQQDTLMARPLSATSIGGR